MDIIFRWFRIVVVPQIVVWYPARFPISVSLLCGSGQPRPGSQPDISMIWWKYLLTAKLIRESSCVVLEINLTEHFSIFNWINVSLAVSGGNDDDEMMLMILQQLLSQFQIWMNFFNWFSEESISIWIPIRGIRLYSHSCRLHLNEILSIFSSR